MRFEPWTRDGVVDEIWKKWFGIDMLYPVGMSAYF